MEIGIYKSFVTNKFMYTVYSKINIYIVYIYIYIYFFLMLMNLQTSFKRVDDNGSCQGYQAIRWDWVGISQKGNVI